MSLEQAAGEIEIEPPHGGTKPLVSGSKILVSVGALIYLFGQYPLRWADFAKLDLVYSALAVGLLVIQILLNCARWRMVIRHFGSSASSRAVVPVYYGSVFFNQVLPSIGGDLIRAIHHRMLKLPVGLVLVSVLLDRGVALVALLFLGLAAVPSLLTVDPEGTAAWSAAGAMIVCLAGGYVFAIVQRVTSQQSVWLKIPSGVRTLCDGISWVLLSRRALLHLMPLSLVVHVGSIAVLYLVALSLSVPLSLTDAFAVGPLLMIATMLPISIGGWGIRETAAVVLLKLAGIEGTEALSISILFGALVLIASLPGAACSVVLAFKADLKTRRGSLERGQPSPQPRR